MCIFILYLYVVGVHIRKEREKRESEREGRKEKARERLCDSMRVCLSLSMDPERRSHKRCHYVTRGINNL